MTIICKFPHAKLMNKNLNRFPACNKMAKRAISLLLLLQIVCATYAATSDAKPGGGVEAACKRISEVKFCVKLLQPYASEFEDNNADKMGYAAISATLAQVQAARAFMVKQATDLESSGAERDAVKDCLEKVGDSVDSLHKAARELDKMKSAKDEKRDSHRANVKQSIKSAIKDQNECSDLLKKQKIKRSENIEEVGRLAEEAAQAGFVAQAFIP